MITMQLNHGILILVVLLVGICTSVKILPPSSLNVRPNGLNHVAQWVINLGHLLLLFKSQIPTHLTFLKFLIIHYFYVYNIGNNKPTFFHA